MKPRVLADKYILSERPIDEGAQAKIYHATDIHTQTIYAAKVLSDINETTVTRLRREVQSQQQINHQNSMPIIDFDQSFTWFIMPLADQVLQLIPKPLADSYLFKVIQACVETLIPAHNMGIIHRDISPKNILHINYEDNPRWVLSDWGFVRLHGQTTVVRTKGEGMGTAGYAAPELWDNPHEATRQSDIYSLGRVIAHCVLGKSPAPNKDLLPEADNTWYDIIHYTTRDDPEKRPTDMEEVKDMLNDIKYYLETGKRKRHRKVDIPKLKFTSSYLEMLDYLWNNGDPIEVTTTDIRSHLKTGLYENNQKLSYKPWSLIETGDAKNYRRLTLKGIGFLMGSEAIPEIIVNSSQGWIPEIGTNYITIDDLRKK